jgi:serine/threonine protein kinase
MSGIPAGAGALLNKRLGKYEILALLALGGTAEIYLARIGGTAGFEKYVVVKCLHDHLADDPDFVKMFLDEARISATLDHSNIVQTFELGEYQNRYYMVMEFLAGLSLAMVVRRAGERLPGGMLPVPLVLNIAAQACAGLHYAHERTQGGKPLNLVHRDISPQNLVISFEGIVKVVDFGIARAEYRETKTKAGTIKGKFAYMSPEQCVANAVDRRTDVFALGVIVHELLTGRRLFKRNSPYETYQAVLECAVEPPSRLNNELDPALDAIVMKSIAKDKEHRYASAEAFGDALLGYLHHRGKGSGAGDLGRFFEAHFNQEIEEHSERMRDLIQAGNVSVDAAMGWGEEEDAKANMTRDLTGRNGDDDVSLDTGEIIEMRPSEASLQKLVGRLETELGTGVAGRHDDDDDVDDGDSHDETNDVDEDEDEDEDRGQPTQITMNPSALLEQLNQQVARNSQQQIIKPGTPAPMGTQTNTGGPAPLPAPPSAPQKKGSGKFPHANLPTVVAADAETEDVETEGETVLQLQSGPLSSIGRAQPDPAQAPTAIGAPIVNAAASAAANKRTEYGITAPAPPSNVEQAGPMSSTQYAVRASQMQQAQGQSPSPYDQHAQQQASLAGYPVMPGGQRPYSTDIAPSGVGAPQRSPYSNAPFDPSAAANLVSPVGEQYPQTDWDRAAAMNATAMPPWKLAMLFIIVVGGALGLTLGIAKLFA